MLKNVGYARVIEKLCIFAVRILFINLNKKTFMRKMIATMAAASATRAAWLSPPKSTMPKMVPATAVLTLVITTSPTKLPTAAMMTAVVGFMALVPTTVAIALGASVGAASNGKFILYAIYALPNIGIFALWFALAASIVSAVTYTRDFVQKLNKKRK